MPCLSVGSMHSCRIYTSHAHILAALSPDAHDDIAYSSGYRPRRMSWRARCDARQVPRAQTGNSLCVSHNSVKSRVRRAVVAAFRMRHNCNNHSTARALLERLEAPGLRLRGRAVGTRGPRYHRGHGRLSRLQACSRVRAPGLVSLLPGMSRSRHSALRSRVEPTVCVSR